jgi:cell division protein FtsL
MATALVASELRKDATKRRPKRRAAKRKRSGVCRILLLAAAVALILGYVGIYAQVTHAGYRRAALLSELRQQRLENEALRVQFQNLTSPERLNAAAQAAGMLPSTEISYIGAPKPIAVARADGER